MKFYISRMICVGRYLVMNFGTLQYLADISIVQILESIGSHEFELPGSKAEGCSQERLIMALTTLPYAIAMGHVILST